jgi:CheY-like chemotaxis protein
VSKVLIVDDDPESRETLATLVRLLIPGVETLLAANGDVGIELALLHHPAAVVLDVEMPLCDGLEVAARIRASMGRSAPVLIGTSGNVFKLEKGLDSGLFDHALTKPILIAELVRLLS